MKKWGFLGALGSLASVPAWAADVPITVTAPELNWTVVGTIMTGMLLASVGFAVYRRVRSVIR